MLECAAFGGAHIVSRRHQDQMFTLPFVFAVVLAGVLLIAVLVLIAMLSRHLKAAQGELDLIGTVASVEKTLNPEGSVLVRGELWRACSRTGATIRCGRVVRVVGASGHLLEVELLRSASP